MGRCVLTPLQMSHQNSDLANTMYSHSAWVGPSSARDLIVTPASMRTVRLRPSILPRGNNFDSKWTKPTCVCLFVRVSLVRGPLEYVFVGGPFGVVFNGCLCWGLLGVVFNRNYRETTYWGNMVAMSTSRLDRPSVSQLFYLTNK